MELFDIWSEGFRATGNYCPAQFVAQVEAPTFREAVIKFSKTEEAEDWGNFNKEQLSFYGCRCFPTQEEARRSFG